MEISNQELELLYEKFIGRAYIKDVLPHGVYANGKLFKELIAAENRHTLKETRPFNEILRTIKDSMEKALLQYLEWPLNKTIKDGIQREYHLFKYTSSSEDLIDTMLLVLDYTDNLSNNKTD